MSGNVPDWLRANHKKTSNSKMQTGVQSRPIFHSEHTDSAIVKEMHMHTNAAFLADGGDPSEEQLKQMGLEASNREREAAGRPGFMDSIRNTVNRFQEGNIDKPGSLAYERYGAGRGRQEYQNQKAFAENAKMQGDGMRNASMVMSGKKAPDVSKAIDEVVATKDISPAPSQEYSKDESMKRDAMTGKAESTPAADMVMRPMGDATPARVRRRTPTTNTAPVSARAPETSAPTRSVVIPNNPRPPVDNESRTSKPAAKGGDNEGRKSKPYPAEQAVQKLGMNFKDADNASRADPSNVAKKKERDRAYKTYMDAMKAMKR